MKRWHIVAVGCSVSMFLQLSSVSAEEDTQLSLPNVEVRLAAAHNMAPIIIEGDQFIVDSRSYQSIAPNRGDIILFRNSEGAEWYSRIVGLPWDRIIISNGISS